MGRRSSPLDTSSGPLARFARELRDLRDSAPADREHAVDKVAFQDGTASRAAIYAALAGKRLPSPQTLKVIVTAWAPGRIDDLPAWMKRRRQIEEELAHDRGSRIRPSPRQSPSPAPPDSVQRFIADVLRLRDAAGLTNVDLARKIGCNSASTIYYLLGRHATRLPPWEFVERIVRAIELPDTQTQLARLRLAWDDVAEASPELAPSERIESRWRSL